MTHNNIINKVVIYSYLYNNTGYKNDTFLYNVSLSIQTITRQIPIYLFNKKKEVVGTKTTLLNENLNKFLYKFKKFTLVKLYNTSIFYKNICSFDSDLNINVCVNNRSYFFEYFNSSTLKYIYKFNLKFIFNKYINNIYKLNYIKNNINFKI
ncbi:hypothetical protein BaOVIS_035160 (apicoplast) [Babesia ovis]|uniref:Ribosomal protein L5 n=1 Tax=Babesia ovis TaxID=5869 RepID=A0A9W5WWN9_BABOV|nr:hypothetical protein BaOVIS_035160 [Babesia ovis]